MAASPIPIDTEFSPNQFIPVITKGIFHLAGKVSGDPQLFAVLFILADSLGRSRRPNSPAPDWTRPLSLVQFSRACKCSTRLMISVLADAEKRGLIASLSPGEAKKLDLPPDGHAQAKRYKACPENWKSAPPYEPERPAVEEIEEQPPAAEEPSPVQITNGPLVLMPGKKSRPMPLDAAIRKYAFDCESSHPLRVDPITVSGTIRFKIRDENTAVVPRTSEVGFTSDQSEGRRINSEPPMKCTSLVGDSLPARLSQMGFLIDAPLAQRIAKRLGPCSLDFFCELVQQRLDRAIRTRKPITQALLPSLAEEAAAKWAVQQAASSRQERDRAATTPELDPVAWLVSQMTFVQNFPNNVSTPETRNEINRIRREHPEIYRRAAELMKQTEA